MVAIAVIIPRTKKIISTRLRALSGFVFWDDGKSCAIGEFMLEAIIDLCRDKTQEAVMFERNTN